MTEIELEPMLQVDESELTLSSLNTQLQHLYSVMEMVVTRLNQLTKSEGVGDDDDEPKINTKPIQSTTTKVKSHRTILLLVTITILLYYTDVISDVFTYLEIQSHGNYTYRFADNYDDMFGSTAKDVGVEYGSLNVQLCTSTSDVSCIISQSYPFGFDAFGISDDKFESAHWTDPCVQRGGYDVEFRRSGSGERSRDHDELIISISNTFALFHSLYVNRTTLRAEREIRLKPDTLSFTFGTWTCYNESTVIDCSSVDGQSIMNDHDVNYVVPVIIGSDASTWYVVYVMVDLLRNVLDLSGLLINIMLIKECVKLLLFISLFLSPSARQGPLISFVITNPLVLVFFISGRSRFFDYYVVKTRTELYGKAKRIFFDVLFEDAPQLYLSISYMIAIDSLSIVPLISAICSGITIIWGVINIIKAFTSGLKAGMSDL